MAAIIFLAENSFKSILKVIFLFEFHWWMLSMSSLAIGRHCFRRWPLPKIISTLLIDVYMSHPCVKMFCNKCIIMLSFPEYALLLNSSGGFAKMNSIYGVSYVNQRLWSIWNTFLRIIGVLYICVLSSDLDLTSQCKSNTQTHHMAPTIELHV